MPILIYLILIVSLIWSCGPNKRIDKVVGQPEDVVIDYSAGPPTLVYSTTKDYSKHVPVLMSDDKSKIVSFPHPRDLYYKGNISYPTQLEGGYLLDNRGISKNVAFLSLSYDEYIALNAIPPVDSLYELVVDKSPLVELYNCGNRHQYKDEVKELNALIISKQIKKCKKVSVD